MDSARNQATPYVRLRNRFGKLILRGGRDRKRRNDVLDPRIVQVVHGVDRELQVASAEISSAQRVQSALMHHDPLPIGKPEMKTNRTGLAEAIAALRTELATAKNEAMSAGGEISRAVDEMKTATEGIRQVAKDVRNETAEAVAALGQLTNGGPE